NQYRHAHGMCCGSLPSTLISTMIYENTAPLLYPKKGSLANRREPRQTRLSRPPSLASQREAIPDDSAYNVRVLPVRPTGTTEALLFLWGELVKLAYQPEKKRE